MGFELKTASCTDWTVKSLMKKLGVTKKDRDKVGCWVDFPPDQKVILKVSSVSSDSKDTGVRIGCQVFLAFDLDGDKDYYISAADLENGIIRETDKTMKRVKLPIPEEYGGGWATGSSTTDAVNTLINRIKDHLNNGPKFKCVQFSECANAWLDLKIGHRALTTLENYEYFLNSKLIPYFGKTSIKEIGPDDIQKFFNSTAHLSKSLNHQCKVILSGVFEYAYRNALIDKNPMQFSYEISKKTGKKVVLQDADLISVIKQLDDAYDYGKLSKIDYLYGCFLCFTSLRRGEILALKWYDLDIDNMEISVSKNLTFPNGRNLGKITTPKDDSYRNVHLNRALYERILKCYGLPNQLTRYYKIFSNNGLYLTRSQFMCMWKRINKVVDLKGATSHSFRASYTSMMNAHCPSADPKVLQTQLGHRTPDLALSVYTKSNTDKVKRAEKEYDEYLCKELGTSDRA